MILDSRICDADDLLDADVTSVGSRGGAIIDHGTSAAYLMISGGFTHALYFSIDHDDHLITGSHRMSYLPIGDIAHLDAVMWQFDPYKKSPARFGQHDRDTVGSFISIGSMAFGE